MIRAAVLLITLAVCAPAQAATGWKPAGLVAPAATEDGKLQAALAVARSYWPDSPCAGREVVHLAADGQITATHTDDTLGMADAATCTVWVRGGQTHAGFCYVLAHELGHLAGRGHAEDGSVMGAGVPNVGACEQLELPAGWYAMVASLPGGGRGWHITPRAATKTAYVAVARPHGARCQRLLTLAHAARPRWWAVRIGRCSKRTTAVPQFGWGKPRLHGH